MSDPEGRLSLETSRPTVPDRKENGKENGKGIMKKEPTSEETIIEFNKIAPEIADKIFKDRVPHLDNILFFTCACVEIIVRDIRGKENILKTMTIYKRDLVFALLPTAMKFLLESGRITESRKLTLEKDFKDRLSVSLKIQNIIDISNNPNLLNDRWKEQIRCRIWCPCFK